MMRISSRWARLALFVGALGLVVSLQTVTAQETKVKAPELKHAMDLSVRKAGQAKFGKDTPKFGVEVFADPNSNTMIYISQAGAIAVANAGKYDGDKPKAPELKNAMDLRVRRANEKNFGKDTPKFGVEVFQEPTTGNILFITETGSIAVVPNRPEVEFTGKDPEWLHAMNLAARPAGMTKFEDEKTPRFGIEVFYDSNTNCIVYINEKGDIAATPGKATTADTVATPEWKHAADLMVRSGGDGDFGDSTPKFGVEVFADPNSKQLLAISEKGKIALPGMASIQTDEQGKAPPWKYGLDLRVRKAGETEIKDAQKFGVEVYSDAATGSLIYITQTGSIAFVKP